MESADIPIRREQAAAEEALKRGPEEWLRWWHETGARELVQRLRDAPSIEEAVERVADYLNHVERDFMGEASAERERANGYLARTLVAWHEWSYLRGGRASAPEL